MSILRKLFKKTFNMDKKKWFYLGLVLLCFLVMIWAFISAEILTTNFSRAQIKTGVNSQNVDAIGIIITETKQGNKHFEIFGETGNYNNDRSVAILNNVIGNLYKDGEVSMSFQSSKGAYDEKNGTITLYENTFIVLKNGTSLEANKLTWQGSDEDIIAEGNVRIKKDSEMFAIADKCVIDPQYERFKIIGNSQTKIYSENN